jgi:hypothetical protein
MLNGNCLTARTLASRSTESECSLSQILEVDPDPKYFLSREHVERMLEHKKPKKAEETRKNLAYFLLEPSLLPTEPQSDRTDDE